MPYKVASEDLALALLKYWKQMFQQETFIKKLKGQTYWFIDPPLGTAYPPCWREINDAFAAGYVASIKDN